MVPEGLLNIAALDPGSMAMAPGGLWAGCWLQGCRLHCEGCANPGFQSTRRIGMLARPESLARWVRGLRGIAGVCFSGGEPMLQARLVRSVARMVKEAGLYVAAYSGYTVEEIRSDVVPGAAGLLAELDLLIDGPFVQGLALPPGHYRGSSNQRLLFFNPALEARAGNSPAKVSCHVRVTPDGLVLTGSGALQVEGVLRRRLLQQAEPKPDDSVAVARSLRSPGHDQEETGKGNDERRRTT